MMNFLRAALDYRTLKEDWENADLLERELYEVNSSGHPAEWEPWRLGDKVKEARKPRPWVGHHPKLRMFQNQHGKWRS